MDVDGLNALIEPIEGSNMTTALLKGTTLDNPAFSVVAGQSVEILLINTNEPIPTIIAAPSEIDAVKGPMGDMAVEIATSEELLKRVQAFVSLNGDYPDEDVPVEGVATSSAIASESVFNLACGLIAASFVAFYVVT